MSDNALETKHLEIAPQPQKPKNHRQQFQQEISTLIEQIELSDLQRQFMKSRWLEQLLWLEGRSQQNRNRYYLLRLITIIGGVIVPALVSLNINTNNKQPVVGWIAFGLSQAVAISAAVEEFFHYGERFRHYRNTAESMKIEGWQFLQLSGPYRQAQTHTEVYRDFAQRVESLIQSDVEGYISQVLPERKKSEEEARSKNG